ncbi:MAG: hypothetical protein KGR48_11190 [Alphaproteobacteria bacterium]|nr:hypothetical protein [Alphaproteobacteria bacterium]MDE2013741.1 hypothetical protein [Alphaproteobacteria bacterium]MDE2073994.1 hypothetical protein [Alphaproteobacteria bacterium]
MNYALSFAPHVPDLVLWLLIAAAVLITAYAFFRRARGAWARGLAFTILLAALANPLIVRETRQPLSDVVALVVDHTQSMDVHGRKAQADKAAAAIKAQLRKLPGLVVRETTVETRNTGEDNGTQLFAALDNALADVPPERVAGAIAITDGEVHDAPAPGQMRLHAPLQVLIAGRHNERDRKLTVISAARFAIVGRDAQIELEVDDLGSPAQGSADIDVRVDGVERGSQTVPIGQRTTISVPITHGGENVIELAAAPGPHELTLQNNRAVVTVNGVRDRLRVLLVSGEPHAGERVWRSLLKSDPSVDLVHFTILRPPDKQDATPVDELSLIVFPTRQLFVEKLDQFDLVIFDRYRERGILPLAYFENIARYVENGGALLVSAGPEFASDQSIYRTPLASVLPAQPTGQVVTGGFRPVVTPTGLAHPVTHDLPGANTATAPPSWGRWFRLIGANKVSGETVMSGPGDQPLLVLDRVGKGRVAEFLSDQAWLWARGYEGGGPDAELLRRLAHWLMKEPELEEERLSASITNGTIAIERHTMAKTARPVTITTPSGKTQTVTLNQTEPGIWRATAKAGELGLYRLTDGVLTAVAAAGPLNPKEVADMRATDAILAPLARASGGSVHWLADGGVPDVRRVPPESLAWGTNWIGLRDNGAYRVTSVEQQALLPPWLALILLLGAVLLAWRLEGR